MYSAYFLLLSSWFVVQKSCCLTAKICTVWMQHVALQLQPSMKTPWGLGSDHRPPTTQCRASSADDTEAAERHWNGRYRQAEGDMELFFKFLTVFLHWCMFPSRVTECSPIWFIHCSTAKLLAHSTMFPASTGLKTIPRVRIGVVIPNFFHLRSMMISPPMQI